VHIILLQHVDLKQGYLFFYVQLASVTCNRKSAMLNIETWICVDISSDIRSAHCGHYYQQSLLWNWMYCAHGL